jgi:hypothetical protein
MEICYFCVALFVRYAGEKELINAKVITAACYRSGSHPSRGKFYRFYPHLPIDLAHPL